MSKLTIVEAVKVIPISESKLRRDLKAGVLSFETAKNGKKVIDTAELERAYGLLTPNETAKNGSGGHDRETEILAMKDNQIADLRNQLEKAEMRETTLIDEKAKLLELLSAEKAEKRALMPPADKNPKSRSWLLRLVGAR